MKQAFLRAKVFYIMWAIVLPLVWSVAPCFAQHRKTSTNTTVKKTSATDKTKTAQSRASFGQYSTEILPNDTITVGDIKFVMVGVQGGVFTMGATKGQGDKPFNQSVDDRKPVHRVALSSFRIGQTPVTQELWEAIMGNYKPPMNYKANKPNLPVSGVDWKYCIEFINRLNEYTGRKFRLPTEAEWEYAARGGNKGHDYMYSGGNNPVEVGWTMSSFEGLDRAAQDVAKKIPNELGIYDMSGNVWEWCLDYYGRYSASAQTNPKGPAYGEYGHVSRGGSWLDPDDNSKVSVREWGFNSAMHGFRLAE